MKKEELFEEVKKILTEKFEIEENDTALEIYEKMLRLLENNLAL